MQFWPKAEGCCCDDEEVPITPCCYEGEANDWSGYPSSILYLSDGHGTIELTRATSGPVTGEAIPPSGSWWGCASRSVSGGRTSSLVDGFLRCSGDPTDFSQDVFFNFYCQGESTGTSGYNLLIFFPACADPFTEAGSITTQPACTCAGVAWENYSYFFVKVTGGPGGFNPTLPTSCSPFVVIFEQDLETAFGPGSPGEFGVGAAIRQIYGGSGATTWTVTE